MEPNLLRAIKRAHGQFQNDRPDEAVESIRGVVKAAPLDSKLVTAATTLLVDNNQLNAAYDILSGYFSAGGMDVDVLESMLMLSMRMEQYGVSKKIGAILISHNSNNENYYVNYCASLMQLDELDEATALLQSILPQFPKSVRLWNILGTIMMMQGNHDLARQFWSEAHKLDPKDFQVVSNLASFSVEGEEQKHWYKKAMALDPEHPQPHLGYALCLFRDGKLSEGYEHYEYRHLLQQDKISVQTMSPAWKNEDLSDKSILVQAEQGIGDEILFSLLFKELCRRAHTVYISCDPRLVSLFERSFPEACVGAYQDAVDGISRVRNFPAVEASVIDYTVQAGSLMRYLWPESAAIPELTAPYFEPDPVLRDTFFKKTERKGARLKVGVSWRSGKVGQGRSNEYVDVAFFEQLIQMEGVDFYALQYGMTKEERSFIDANMPDLHVFDDVDLKQDIEANFALIDVLDVVIGPGTSTQMFAITSNKPTIYIAAEKPWWSFSGGGGFSAVTWAPNCTIISSEDPDAKQQIKEYLTTFDAEAQNKSG
ncbi:tetratricopeptide repeat protein [Kordiimonas aquimaris]|uniref:tetratricopeptide repeat protein n=1 Tax=Kordiimonas aquimaris TaxID=707591 RepID=UPI0021D1C95E|nr:hypothetical protein [Kordiimonas aquimaris]